MPNVRSLSLNSNGISVTAANGANSTISKATILGTISVTLGTDQAKINAAIVAVTQSIEFSCGAEMVPSSKITFDCAIDGTPLTLSVAT